MLLGLGELVVVSQRARRCAVARSLYVALRAHRRMTIADFRDIATGLK